MKKEKSKYPKGVLEAVRVIVDYFKTHTKNPNERLEYGFNAGLHISGELVDAAQALKKIPASALMKLWNNNANRQYLRPCLHLTGKRRKSCNARLKEFPDLKKWKRFIDMVNKDDWCLGIKPSANYPGYHVNFDWFIRPGNIVKFLEGEFGQVSKGKPESKREEYGEELDKRSNY